MRITFVNFRIHDLVFLRIAKSRLTNFLLLIQNEVYGDLRLHFDWFMIQDVRTILPLLHGSLGRKYQHRRAANCLNMFDVPVFCNRCQQDHRPL